LESLVVSSIVIFVFFLSLHCTAHQPPPFIPPHSVSPIFSALSTAKIVCFLLLLFCYIVCLLFPCSFSSVTKVLLLLPFDTTFVGVFLQNAKEPPTFHARRSFLYLTFFVVFFFGFILHALD
jgi:hypothetical protein